MKIKTICKYCSSEIIYDTEQKRTLERDTNRIHVCKSRLTKCRYCGKEIYFSFKKSIKGKSTAFNADTQLKHNCENKQEQINGKETHSTIQ